MVIRHFSKAATYKIFCSSFFRLETIDGSAVEGEDYESINEILTFEPNEREKEV